jgi:hypothetical protein
MLSINTALHLVGALLFSAGAGIAIANETVGTMRSDTYGSISESALAGCAGCSNRTRGYQWASSEAIRSIESCENAPWEFSEGCRDYLSEKRP